MDPELILHKVKTRIRQKEAIQHQQGILRGNTDTHVASDLKKLSKQGVSILVVLSLTRMTAHLALQRHVHAVVKQNIHVINALHEKQNVLSAIRRGITVACVC